MNRIKPALEEAEFGESPGQVALPVSLAPMAQLGAKLGRIADGTAEKLGHRRQP
ncbi:MAG: hypothetical protein U0744_17965 [Gemmataceae bacterium]